MRTSAPPASGRTSSTVATRTRLCVRSRRPSRRWRVPRTSLAFASGMGAIATVVLALCSLRRPHRRPAPDLLGDARLPAGAVRSIRHRSHPRRRHRTGSVRGCGPARQDDAGARRDPVQPAARARRPRRARRAARAVHDGRLHLRHAARAAAAGPRRAPVAALGDEGHRRPQRRHARRGLRRARADRLDLGVLDRCTAPPRRRSTRSNALRGIRTLSVRTAHQSASALFLAEALSDHPAVSAVHYPGLSSHPQFDLAKRQMRHGGTVLALELAGGRPAAEALLSNVRIARVATSLGGPETLLCHPATSTHASLTPAEAAATGVHRGAAADVGRSRGPERRARRPDRRTRVTGLLR